MADALPMPFPIDDDGSEDLQAQLSAYPIRAKNAAYGRSRWARLADLGAITAPVDRSHSATFESVRPIVEDPTTRGLMLAHPCDIYLSRAMQEANISVNGRTSAGKTQNVINAILCDHGANRNVSIVAIVGKPETTETARSLVWDFRQGEELRVVNFANRYRSTHRYQPFLNGITRNEPGLILAKVSDFLAASDAGFRHRDPFWSTTAARIITGCILRGVQKFGDFAPADIHTVLEQPANQLIAFLEDGEHVPFANAVAAFIASNGQNSNSCVATTQSYSRLFADSDVAAVTAKDDLDLRELVRKPSVLIVEVPMHEQTRCRPLVNNLIATIFAVATEEAQKHPRQRLPHPLRIIIDDFPLTTGAIPKFAEYLNLGRSYGIGVTAAMHSRASVEHFFGTEAGLVLAGFNNQIFLSPVDQYDAEYASRMAGSMTAEAPGAHGLPNANQVVQRPLLSPEDVRSSFYDDELGSAATFFFGTLPPFQAFLRPSFQSPIFGPLVAASQRRPIINDETDAIPLWQPQYVPPTSIKTETEQLLEGRYKSLVTLLLDQTSDADREWWRRFEARQAHDVNFLLLPAQRMAASSITVMEVRETMALQVKKDILEAIEDIRRRRRETRDFRFR